MAIQEKLKQVIIDLTKESIKYPRMKTTDVAYMLSMILDKFPENTELTIKNQ